MAKAKPKRKQKGKGNNDETPQKRKKGTDKKGNASVSPRTDGTPSSVAKNIKFITNAKTKQIMGTKIRKVDLTEYERKETDALNTINSSTTLTTVKVHNSMWPFCCECYAEDDTIFFMRNQANHNHINPKLANEITNNLLGNPIAADRSGSVHEQNLGDDMLLLLTYNNKVTTRDFFFAFCKNN